MDGRIRLHCIFDYLSRFSLGHNGMMALKGSGIILLVFRRIQCLWHVNFVAKLVRCTDNMTSHRRSHQVDKLSRHSMPAMDTLSSLLEQHQAAAYFQSLWK